MPQIFSPFEIQASPEALRQLTAGLDGWRVERRGPQASNASNVWLRDAGGSVWLVDVDSARPGSDVRGLHARPVEPGRVARPMGALAAAGAARRCARAPYRAPATRPPPPAAPVDFEPWPLASWRTEVLRRAEYIDWGVEAGPTVGDHPNFQSAARPGQVRGKPAPRARWRRASCSPATRPSASHRGGLAAAEQLVVTEDAAPIEAFLAGVRAGRNGRLSSGPNIRGSVLVFVAEER